MTDEAVIVAARREVEGLTSWPRVQWFAYDAQIRGVPVNPTEDRVVIDRAAVLAILDHLLEDLAVNTAYQAPKTDSEDQPESPDRA